MGVHDKENIYRSIKDESLGTAQLGGSLDNHLECGYYLVEINNSDRIDLGLPVEKCGNEHYLKAHLFVTDSGNEDELQKNRVIGQTLVLSQCDDGKTSIYSRSYSSIGDGYKWSHWSKAQQDVQVGQVTSLDGFTSSGLYSGVYSVAGRSPETFVLTVIDNDVAATTAGKVRSISQFKNSLNVDGTFSYKTRVGNGKGKIEWGSWVDMAAADSTDIQDNSITSQKLAVDVREKVDYPLRPLFVAAGANYNEETGYYSLNGVNDLSEDDINVSYAYKDIVYNLDKGRLAQSLKSLRAIYPYRYPIMQDAYKHSGSLKGVHLFRETAIEVFRVTSPATSSLDDTRIAFMLPCVILTGTFAACRKLHTVYPMDLSACTTLGNDTFQNCPALVELRLWGLKLALYVGDSPLLSKESILYIVKYASPTSVITVTLHPDAYARLADDADVVSALESQPLVSLVCA